MNVDIAGNGRAGASSKCTEAGNEPHQFLRCQLFHGAAGMTGPRLLGRSCPQLAAGCKQIPAVPWGGSALLPAGTWPWGAGNGPSSVSVLARLWVTVGIQAFKQKVCLQGDNLDEGLSLLPAVFQSLLPMSPNSAKHV